LPGVEMPEGLDPEKETGPRKIEGFHVSWKYSKSSQKKKKKKGCDSGAKRLQRTKDLGIKKEWKARELRPFKVLAAFLKKKKAPWGGQPGERGVKKKKVGGG